MNITHGLVTGQVLQRIHKQFANATISGAAQSQGEILATLSKGGKPLAGWKSRKVGISKGGNFTIKLAKIPTGGPYALQLKVGKESLVVKDIYVGDVWVMAGQSNMEGCGRLANAPKPHPLVQAFYMNRKWGLAREPIHVLGESPDPVHFPNGLQCDPVEARRVREGVARGVGVGIYFGVEMVKRSKGVPQGFICTAHGGTSMNQWSPSLKDQGGNSLYGSMMLSIQATGQPVAGVLWYQGESDTDAKSAAVYTERMKELVASVRKDLKQPKLPWVIVQLAGVVLLNENPMWNAIQEQQRVLKNHIPYLESVPAIDLPLDDNIHLSAKAFPRLGHRMASMMDRLAYGNKKELPAPDLDKVVYGGGKKSWASRVLITFKNVQGGLKSLDEPTGFAILDENKNPLSVIIKTELIGNSVLLELNYTPKMAYVAYGHGLKPYTNITDGRGIPIPVFAAQPIYGQVAISPYQKTWRVSETVPAVKALDRLPVPDASKFKLEEKTFQENFEGFINMHDRWMKESGHAFFFSEFECPEAMPLKVCMGYDGPFRLWVDDKPFYADIWGSNPCLPDEWEKTMKFSAGKHKLTVAMDLNAGMSFGFFLRFKRADLSEAQLKSGKYAMPIVK